MKLTIEEVEKRVSDSYEVPNRVCDVAAKPIVSIRTSTYNHAKYIRECIEGVLMQKTDFPVEYIIGEDFSTDGAREIVMEYAEKYPEIIRVITADYNVGSKANGRRTLRASRGQYIAICEGDDYWTDPYKLQKQVALLESNPNCFMCVAKTRVKYENSDRASIVYEGLPKEYLSFDDFFSRCYLHTSTYMIRSYREVVEKWGKYIRLSDTSLRYIYSDMGPVVFLPEVVSVYRITGAGIWTSLSEGKKLKEEIDLNESFYRHFHLKYKKRFSVRLMGQYLRGIVLNIQSRHWRSLLSHLGGFLRHAGRSPILALKLILRRIYLKCRSIVSSARVQTTN